MDAHRGPVLSLRLRVCLLCLFTSLILLPAFQRAEAAGPYLSLNYVRCTRNATSELSTTFSRNLDTALHNLTTLSSQGTKYATTAAGSGAAMVYAVFQCRGDQTLQLCLECMQNATARLPQSDCPVSVGARIQLDGCYVRYDNQSFFTLDTSFVIGLCNTGQTTNVAVLTGIAGVVANVTSLAPKQGGFATAVSASGEYALAQCLGYLNESECSDCLSSTSYRSVCEAGAALGAQVHLGSCYYRYELSSFFETPPSPPPRPLISSPAPASLGLPPPTKSSGSKTPIIVGVVVGILILTSALCAIVVWRYKAGKIMGEKRLDKAASWPRQLLQSKAQLFSLQELEEATGHFHPTNMLGAGGFGMVYKGTLLGGEQVAIKKLSIRSQEGKQEFLNEVNLITSVQHKNLIRLLGCCVEGPERILVYEYLPNKSLDFFLFGESRRLNWSTRYGIILGMAKGLAYLHEESQIRIVHRDIKPSNVLLDDQLNPVIADFGLARLVRESATHVNTGVAGTIGYLAPEYVIYGDLSEKVDVFSFGLVSLEILSGKQNTQSSLLTLVWENYQRGKTLDLVDNKLGNAFSPEEAIRVVHVALLCTQENPKRRPAMSMVILWLSGTSAILDIPTMPTFLKYNENMGDAEHQFTSHSSTSSQSAQFSRPDSRFSGQAQSVSQFMDPR